MNTEEFLRSQIRKILTEQSGEDDATSRIRSVGVGRGGWKGRVKEAGALAKEDPAKLSKSKTHPAPGATERSGSPLSLFALGSYSPPRKS